MKSLILVHPIVLVTILKEQYSNGSNLLSKRKTGCLLGSSKKNRIICRSSFEVPFRENNENKIFLDQNYLKTMILLHKKINSKEDFIGSYTIEKKMSQQTKKIIEIYNFYTKNPIHLNSWIDMDMKKLVIEGYNILDNDNTYEAKNFRGIRVKIGITDSEEITVFHVLKNSINWKSHYKNNWFNDWSQALKEFLNIIENCSNQKSIFKDFYTLFNDIKKHRGLDLKKFYNLKKIKFSNRIEYLYLRYYLESIQSQEKVMNFIQEKCISGLLCKYDKRISR
jgi:hypothetical protein